MKFFYALLFLSVFHVCGQEIELDNIAVSERMQEALNRYTFMFRNGTVLEKLACLDQRLYKNVKLDRYSNLHTKRYKEIDTTKAFTVKSTYSKPTIECVSKAYKTKKALYVIVEYSDLRTTVFSAAFLKELREKDSISKTFPRRSGIIPSGEFVKSNNYETLSYDREKRVSVTKTFYRICMVKIKNSNEWKLIPRQAIAHVWDYKYLKFRNKIIPRAIRDRLNARLNTQPCAEF
ncbi:MAG: hypothetical protein AB8B65_10750 [Kordia sp.]|uniref:hypothetical protein n=1 Tax=Kordia sp. TaxID=1965332 RepID=UPI00385977E3